MERETGFEPASSGLESPRSTVELLPLGEFGFATAKGSHAVAVGANHIAFGNLLENPLKACAADHPGDLLDLRAGITVIEFHREGRIGAVTVVTGSRA